MTVFVARWEEVSRLAGAVGVSDASLAARYEETVAQGSAALAEAPSA